VGFGKQPAAVDDEEIDAIRRVMRSELPAKAAPFLRCGDKVQLVAGPLTGLTGLLIQQKDGDRVLVQVTLINRGLAVDIESSWVRPLDSAAERRSFQAAAGRL